MNRVEAESTNSLLEVLIISRSGASVIMYVYVCVCLVPSRVVQAHEQTVMQRPQLFDLVGPT